MPNGRSTPSGTDAPFQDDFHRNRSCSNEESLAITGLRNSIPLSVSVYEIACLVSAPHREWISPSGETAANTAVGNGCGTDAARVLWSFGVDRICWDCFASPTEHSDCPDTKPDSWHCRMERWKDLPLCQKREWPAVLTDLKAFPPVKNIDI